MSTPEADPQLTIPQPIDRDPDAFVENIYPIAGAESVPDLASQDIMGAHLVERYEPKQETTTRVVLTPSGVRLPSIQRVPNGTKEVTRRRRTDEYLITRKVAAIASIGLTALSFAASNHETITKGAEYVGHKVYRVFDPLDTKTVIEREEATTPGKVRDIRMTIDTTNKVGQTDVDNKAVSSFVRKIDNARMRGGKVISFSLRGNTSDDFGSESSIGVADAGNTQIGRDRVKTVRQALSKDGLTISKSKIDISQKEHILTKAQQADAKKAAQEAGFDSISQAVNAVDNGQPVPKRLSQKIKQLFTGTKNRGVTLDAKIEYPGEAVTTVTYTPKVEKEKDNTPDVPAPGLFLPIPIFPLRRRERYTKIKQQNRWKFTPSKKLWRPDVIKEDKEQAWLRIRPEAVQKDGTLVDTAWAYTRSYEYLMRDDRISSVLRADYTINDQKKSLRTMFVDGEPAPETVKAFEKLLTAFASMEQGKIADRVTGIVVYPTENTGTHHKDPKRIGLGIDTQLDDRVLGTYTYPLKLVELHVPKDVTSEELIELFESFDGPVFTAAHEVAGHATDVSDQKLKLRRVRALGIPNAHVIDGEPRAFKMSRLENVLRKLPLSVWHKKPTDSLQFDVEYTVLDNAGNPVPIRSRVPEYGDQLTHASNATIVDHLPTRYAATNVSEHYAETAAAVTTGIEIPFEEASIKVALRKTANQKQAQFATGYRPDVRGQSVFTKSVGAIESAFPVAFTDPIPVSINQLNPTEDPLLRQEIIRARSSNILRKNQMVAILARVARRNKSGE